MSKYNYEQTRNDYHTPPELVEMALKYFKLKEFDLDVCATEFNIPARLYYTVEGLFSDGWHKLADNDGLTGEWFAHNWCNPPFNECEKWVKKAYEEQQNGNSTVMLIPVRTETKYWKIYIIDNPLIDLNKDVIWLRKGYRFINPIDNKPMGVFKNPLALVFFNASLNNIQAQQTLFVKEA